MHQEENKYKIWLEVDEYDIETDKRSGEEYCNAMIIYPNGSTVGLNIWSEKYFLNNLNNIDWIDEGFAIFPDIVVRNYQASSIRKAIINLIEKQKYLKVRDFPHKD